MTTADRKAFFDTKTSRVGVELVEISEASISTIYLSRNISNISSNGNTYVACPMEVVTPNKGSDIETGSLRISAVPIEYLQAIQELPVDSVITVRIMYIFTDSPNDYVDGPFSFTVNDASIQTSTGIIELSLEIESPMEYVVSTQEYNNESCPGIYV